MRRSQWFSLLTNDTAYCTAAAVRVVQLPWEDASKKYHIMLCAGDFVASAPRDCNVVRHSNVPLVVYACIRYDAVQLSDGARKGRLGEGVIKHFLQNQNSFKCKEAIDAHQHRKCLYI